MKKLFHAKLQSPFVRKVLCGLGCIIILLVVFQAGVHVGYHKAAFSYRFGDNYERNFGGHRHERGLFGMREGEGFAETHGAMGKILSIAPNTITIEDRNNIEKIIVLNGNTLIKRFRDNVTPADLHVDDFVVVIGTPNDQSEVEAKLIRIMPAPREEMHRGINATNTPQ